MVLFVPELGAEERHVIPAMKFLRDDSVHYYWSPDREVMSMFGASIGHEVDLWDYWAIYDRELQWTGSSPPEPSFWQHQMAGLPIDAKLDVSEFNERVRSRLAQ